MIVASGRVANVYPDTAGVVVTADAAASDTVLAVRDASGLVGYPDGLLQLPDGLLAAVQGIAFGPGPADPDLVTLTSGLLADLTAEVQLDLYEVDVDGNQVAVVSYWATVLLDDGDIAEAVVDPQWITHLRLGIRDTGRQERVVVERESDIGEWLLRRPLRRVPKVDAGFLHPDLPMTPGAFTTAMDERGDEFANRIRPDSLQSGDVNADIKVKGSWTTGGTAGQGSVVQNAQGFFTVQPDGTPRSAYPNDPDQPDQHRGDGHFDRMSSSGTASFTGSATVEAESDLILASALVAAPTAVPTVIPYWPTTQYPGPQKYQNKTGVAFDSVNGFGKTLIVRTGAPPVIAEWRIGDLVYFDTHRFTSPTGTIVGIAWSNLNDRLITLEWDAGWQVRYWDRVGGNYDYDAALSWTWTDGDPLNATNSPTITCRTLTGADRVLIAQSQTDGTVTFYPYDDAVAAATVTTSTPLDAGHLAGVVDLATQFAVAAQTATVNADGTPQLAIVDVATGDTQMIPVGNGNPACAGLARLETDLTSSSFYYLSRADHSIIRHHAVDQSGYWWAQCSWLDTATGFETTPGPAVRFTATPGAALIVGMPAIPPQADSILVYIGPGTTQPANSAMTQQGISVTPGQTFLRVLIITSGGGNPLTVGTLMASRAGAIRDADGLLLLDGNRQGWLVNAGGRTIDGGLM